MRNIVFTVFIFLVLATTGNISSADENYVRGTPEQAIEMAQQVRKKFGTDGLAKTIIAINTADHDFFKGDLYPFIVRTDGLMIAHYFTPLLGRNMMEAQDRKGVFFFREMIRTIQEKGKGWISYDFVNPATGNWELKIVYVESLDRDLFVGVGVYREVADL